MKFLTLIRDNKETLAVRIDDKVLDLATTLENHPGANIPTNIMEVIKLGDKGVKEIQQFIDNLPTHEAIYIEEDSINWGPAITAPSKIICVGLNYKKHADETNSPYPDQPILFNKFNNTLTGNRQNIKVPKVTEQLDYEVELGIVIGKEAKEVSKEKALDYVFGYVTVNDLSARDLQFASSQWLLGKCCDDFTPVGPYLVTKNEIEDPNNLKLKTTLNGVEKQNSNTSDMLFNCQEIISYISQHMTLVPGDLILTGTPEGVILGDPVNERIYLQPGDEVTVEVEQLGSITNLFIADK